MADSILARSCARMQSMAPVLAIMRLVAAASQEVSSGVQKALMEMDVRVATVGKDLSGVWKGVIGVDLTRIEAWMRWHVRFGIVPVPPLPRRRFPDGSVGPEPVAFPPIASDPATLEASGSLPWQRKSG